VVHGWRKIGDFVARHLRWAQMRRRISPAYFGEPLLNPGFWLLAAAIAAAAAGAPVAALAAAAALVLEVGLEAGLGVAAGVAGRLLVDSFPLVRFLGGTSLAVWG
jgi:hypothetical protein